jgi:hypothetical protein
MAEATPSSHSTSRSDDPTPATTVTIRRAVEGDGAVVYVVSDEDSEFARSTLIADALHYASDLLYGPGTGPRGTVWNLLKATEMYCDVGEQTSRSSTPGGPFGV